jgi:hypothetical protein
MKRLVQLSAFLLFFSLAVNAQPASTVFDFHPYFSGGLQAGYNGGLSFQATGTMSNFAQDLPLSLRGSFSYTFLDPGSPTAARKIFINDNTNGTPEKDGHTWDMRLDFMLNTNFLTRNSFLFLGPRYSMFTGNFNFVGGNEFFSITSNQFGLGGGLESAFRMGNRMNFVISAGADYFFSSNIAGHDTQYAPDGQDINPRNYTYTDADNAINQPKLQFRIMTGFNYFF